MICTYWQTPRADWPNPSDLALEPDVSPGLDEDQRADLMAELVALQATAHGGAR